MEKGLIFNIQKFSIHDGPGIRTTVFFKGCPLRCRWCQNPEGLETTRQVLYFKTKCIHCRCCQQFNEQIEYLERVTLHFMDKYKCDFEVQFDFC